MGLVTGVSTRAKATAVSSSATRGPREWSGLPRRHPGTAPGREDVAAAAVALRWRSYLAVLADRGKLLWSAVRNPSLSRISDDEMARINIEASAAMAEWIDILRADPSDHAWLPERP